MSIYTRTGDKGSTSLFGGKRVSKSDRRIETCGLIDELTSYLGLVINKLPDDSDKTLLIVIQKDLYKIMAYISGAKVDLAFINNRTRSFEKRIDTIDTMLPRLTKFLLPQGTELSCLLHVTRTVCRRTERVTVKNNTGINTVQYLNRLSDLLFTLARFYNKKETTVSL